MIKELIDLQRNSKATCVFIKTKDIQKLLPTFIVNANDSNKLLLADDKSFVEKIDILSNLSKIFYFVITGIDELPIESQNIYVGLVKDREINGYYLPNNCVIVFAVKDRAGLKKVSQELYHFAVVAF